VVRFTETGVVFEDGEEVKADAVIFVTGYLIKFPFLSSDVAKVERKRIPLFKYVFAQSQALAHTVPIG